MFRLAVVVLSLFAISTINAEASAGYYTIVGSNQIHPYSEYYVAVNLHEASKPNTVKLTIENGENFRLTKEVTVEPFSTETVVFETGQLPPESDGGYRLIAEGVSGIIFRNETSLAFNEKRCSTFIQTDKAIYKPGDTIQFRVIVVDDNIKAVHIEGDMHIHITDGKANRIKQWTNVSLSHGVYSNELQLSSYPVLGDWSIVVDVFGEKKTKTVEVAEYVLPKFEVIIDTRKFITFKDGKVQATVRAKYTYGKPVRGEAAVSVSEKKIGFSPLESTVVRKVIKLNGKGFVEIDLADLKLNSPFYSDITIDAEVEEELTGRKHNASMVVNIRKSPYSIQNIDHIYTFTPEVPLHFKIQIVRYDGEPIPPHQRSIDIILSPEEYQESNKDFVSETLTLDDAGFVTFIKTFSTESAGQYLSAKYLDNIEHIVHLTPALAKTGHQLSIKVLTEKPNVALPVSLEIESNSPISYFTYQIFGRGKLLQTSTVRIANDEAKVFKFTPSPEMFPTAKIVAYYLNGADMVSTSTDIPLAQDPSNEITLKTSVKQAKPGEQIELTVNSQPDSFIGLLGVDQSVLLLKSGNDLSSTLIKNDLNEYSLRNSNHNNRHPFSHSYDPSAKDFSSVGAFILSNMKFEPVLYALAFASPVVRIPQPVPIGARPPPAPLVTPTIRKEFPETWIWDDLKSGPNGSLSLSKKVPDTITSWIITGFSLNAETGLTLTEVPTKFNVFQSFFVSLNLPYSIKRGEIVSIPIVVFNYLESSVEAEVTLHNEDQAFEFVEVTNDVNEVPNLELKRSVSVAVKANDGSAVSFLIKPTKVGPITIKVTATSPLAGDGIERILPVEAEGVPQYVNKAIFVDLREKNDFQSTLNVDIPKTAVPDSSRVEVSAIGDILGSTIKNLDQLIRMPHGCGEQNMLNFVPNIVILNYLKSIHQLTEAIETKAKRYMESGYQRELTYKHADGSFSAFGESDKNGSTWLTAFVARSFRQAAEHIDIDEKVIDNALKWMSSVQSENGSFPEVGNVVHTDMQGGAGKGIALTAYTLIAFLENKSFIPIYQSTIDKALDYIVKYVISVDDVYTMALASYALELADHSAKSEILNKFDSKATVAEGYRYWTKPIPASESHNIWYSKPNSVNTEMSAYALLTFIPTKPIEEMIMIMKWLLSQRNENGGFQSTQDTVVGIQALAKIAEKISVVENDLKMTVSYGNSGESKINVNKENSLIHQQYVIPSETNDVKLSATGHGFALFELSYVYNIDDNGASPRFTISAVVKPSSSPSLLEVSVCTSFIADDDASQSNMAVMEVDFPSGFTFDTDHASELKAYENVKTIETKNGDTKVIIYFDHITKELCPTVFAIRTHKVAKQKPAAISVYDYYDTTRRASSFYNIGETSLCDICEGDECIKSCPT